MTTNISGYAYGAYPSPPSTVTLADFELMGKSVLFDEADVKHLRLPQDVVKD